MTFFLFPFCQIFLTIVWKCCFVISLIVWSCKQWEGWSRVRLGKLLGCGLTVSQSVRFRISLHSSSIVFKAATSEHFSARLPVRLILATYCNNTRSFHRDRSAFFSRVRPTFFPATAGVSAFSTLIIVKTPSVDVQTQTESAQILSSWEENNWMLFLVHENSAGHFLVREQLKQKMSFVTEAIRFMSTIWTILKSDSPKGEVQ